MMELPAEHPLRRLRHELRGRANTMLMCAAALPGIAERQEKLEFLEEVVRAAEDIVQLLDELEAMGEPGVGG